MDKTQFDFEWGRVRYELKKRFKKDKLPDMNAILYLIGIQELGKIPSEFSKEEKQDLMHIAVCKLMSGDGYYFNRGRDDDGWPIWDEVKKPEAKSEEEAELYLKTRIIEYFKGIFY